MLRTFLFGLQIGLLLLIPVFPISAQSQPSAQRPLQRFVFQENILGFTFILELYSQQEKQAYQLAQDIWHTLQLQTHALRPTALKRLVKSAEREYTPISDTMFLLLQTHLKYFRLSQGALDPTAAPLYHFWGFTPEALSYRIPSPTEWNQLRATIDGNALQLEEKSPRLKINRPGIQLHLHPGLQGFLIDQGIPLLKQSGLPAAALSTREVGYYFGIPPDAQAWKIPMPDPERPGKVFTYFYLSNQALAQINTSQQGFSQGGLYFHSLLDVRTGQPTREGLAVSISQSSAFAAELSAHLLIRMNDRECKQLVSQLPPLRALKLVKRNGLLIPLEYQH